MEKYPKHHKNPELPFMGYDLFEENIQLQLSKWYQDLKDIDAPRPKRRKVMHAEEIADAKELIIHSMLVYLKAMLVDEDTLGYGNVLTHHPELVKIQRIFINNQTELNFLPVYVLKHYQDTPYIKTKYTSTKIIIDNNLQKKLIEINKKLKK